MLLDHVLYQAQVTATGGRAGRVVSSDGVLDVPLTTPCALGGAGGRGTTDRARPLGGRVCHDEEWRALLGQQQVIRTNVASAHGPVDMLRLHRQRAHISQ